ncbi:MAG TPA: glycosyltransferase family 4 protein [Phenylobacterium sp.]|jgi:glycosyltransferase involved in cell wall biosynthesis|nr:glycosyltransferase family 4 protein [Phenylobacterium sp.]
MPAPLSDAVIRFEPDGFDLNRPWLLGRQSAGHSFLRAAVEGRGEGPVFGYTAFSSSAEMFRGMVGGFDPTAEPTWIPAQFLERVGASRGVLYLSDPSLTAFARLRQRVGPASYSLCGVTHTLATAGTQQMIADLLLEAVMPWDALICTSNAALETVRRVLAAQIDFLHWRFGRGAQLRLPQLPVIPLGVHCRDFAFSTDEKAAARQALGLAPDEVAALYVGRLVYAGKAHPFPMFQGLQAAAEQSGKKIALILCGRAPNQPLAETYLTGAARYAPDLRILRVDSTADESRRQAWAAGDIFVSLAEGIQETFGLTPLEAMAAGLPAVVTDWNGYRETVRDGIDGFRIDTWAPQPSASGAAYALRQELELIEYDNYCWAAASTTSVDIRQLADRLTALVTQPDLRRRMGEAGQARAREVFDWRHIFKRYQALWGDLNARRAAANPEERAWAQAAPKIPSSRLDPFESFGHYPTAQIRPDTMVTLAPGATLEICRERLADPLFPYINAPDALTAPAWAVLEAGPATVVTLARATDLSTGWVLVLIGALAKMGLVRLDAAAGWA